MRSEEAKPVRLDDYRVPAFLIDTVDLDVALDPHATRVVATLNLRRNPASPETGPLVLDGDGLTLVSASLDGRPLDAGAYSATPDRFVLATPPHAPFALTLETRVDPTGNTQLMGLYRSRGTWCTQCEAEGFRRITYFLDRPDVMAVYTTRISADRAEAPVLLGNGNRVDAGLLEGGRHYAVWHDPHPKPAYLFALVGGDLARVGGAFVTRSGRRVELGIFVEPGKEARCGYAMDALIRSMKWDEDVFGCEYDLDVFNIVAVSDFNMGAMENKGLNIFNDKYVLATPETATDQDYAAIEAIIAHEYFHNWTGNRITCRDWFQLCLKEGLTVFRDQEFSSDMRSRPVKRIADVRLLRSHQFAEDSGPLAHPVRPAQYREINNFYTATVYEKGAEVIRALKVLIGDEAFTRGMRLYLTRHDGEAATVEQFIACFAEASGQDLTAFFRWYTQAGTPQVMVKSRHDAGAGTLTLDLSQVVPPTPSQPVKEPAVIPLVIGLVGADGNDLPLIDAASGKPLARPVIVLDTTEKQVVFAGLADRPVVSINRGFSAPVKLSSDLTDADLAFLARHDGDPFNRWQAVQTIAMATLVERAEALRHGGGFHIGTVVVDAVGSMLADPRLDNAFVAQAVTLPSEADIAREIGTGVDPDAILAARKGLRAEIGASLADELGARHTRLAQQGYAYSPDAANAGRRSLHNACLDLLMAAGAPGAIERARAQYDAADNMTDRFAALAALTQVEGPVREEALADFYTRFEDDPLVVDKWFALQASIAETGTLDRVKRLMEHKAFSLGNPNRVRSLIGAFAQGNQTQFNRADGAGYAFLAEIVLTLDATNPQVAARLLAAFKSFRALEPVRREAARAALEKVAAHPNLSRDTADIVQRSLA